MELVLEQWRSFTKENGETFALTKSPQTSLTYFVKALVLSKYIKTSNL